MAQYTEAQLAALKAAKASGVTRMTYEGKTIEYRSMDELDRAIAAVEGELSAAAKPRVSRVLLSSRRGV